MLNTSRVWKLFLAALWAALAVAISSSCNPETRPPAPISEAPANQAASS
jgi:hypothetical protein